MEINKPYYIKELFTKEINDVIYCGVIFKRSYFAIGGNQNIYILDLTKKFEIIIIIKDAHKNKISQLLEAPDGRLISTSFDGMIKLWKIDPALKVYYESNNYSENILLKVPGATNYWIHGGIILGIYFFAICEIDRILVYDLSRDKFFANIKVNEMIENKYKGKPKLRGGNGAGGGHCMSELDSDLQNGILKGIGVLIDCSGFATKIDKDSFVGEKLNKEKKNFYGSRMVHNPPKHNYITISLDKDFSEYNQIPIPEYSGPFYYERRIYNLPWRGGRGAVVVPKYGYFIYGDVNRIIVIDIKKFEIYKDINLYNLGFCGNFLSVQGDNKVLFSYDGKPTWYTLNKSYNINNKFAEMDLKTFEIRQYPEIISNGYLTSLKRIPKTQLFLLIDGNGRIKLYQEKF